MKVDIRNLTELRSRIERVRLSVPKTVGLTALRSAENVKVRAAKDLRKVVNLKATKIKEQIEARGRREGVVVVRFLKNSFSVAHYGARKIPRTLPRKLGLGEDPLPGVRFKIWKGGQWDAPRGSFWTARGGQEFWKRKRKGNKYTGTIYGRTPTKPLYGPAISTIIRKNLDILDGLDEFAQERVLVHANRLIDSQIDRMQGLF